ncbi:MAG: trigger factor [Lachnospiraceae bacterium]|nr:trigger factor [Lachnospiraceae bacterium]
MSVQVEKLEHNMVKLTIEVEAAEFDAATKRAYNKKKSSFNLPGFRKGKVPMNVIEKTYGAGVFYEDAANDIMPKAYADALDEAGIDVVSRPEIDVTKIGKGESFVFTATVAVKPEVTLGQYKGLEVQKDSVEVTEEEVEAELKKAQEQNAREITVEDRAVKEGDVITLDYAGTIDGVPFDGGTASSQKLEIGSHSFIDTFEDQLVGLNIGDEKDVEVTFPEEYHAPELAGKPATFHVKVLGITEKQLPEIDDDFAQDTTEFDSLEEYKADVRAKLEKSKEDQAKSAMQNVLVEKAVEGATMDIPDAMIDSQVEQMVDEFKQRVSYQGISFEQYLQFTGQNLEALEESMRPEAVKRIQGSLVLEAIVAAESIEATDEDLNKEMEKMASMYQMDVEQIASFIQDEQKENMKKDIAIQKAVEFLAAEANVTEASDELDFEAE